MISATDMWLVACQDVQEEGTRRLSRDGPCQEVIGWQGVIDPNRNFITLPERKMSASFAAAETLWYLSGERSTAHLIPYAPQYARFTEPNGKAHGAYGHRWKSQGNQLATVIDLLNKKPDTRQAIMTAWDSSDLPHACAGDKQDIPCTLSWQFLIVKGKLELVVSMRSEDLWLGFPYDVFSNTILQRLVADAIGVPTGRYHHNVGSLHIYDRDADKFDPAIAALELGYMPAPAHTWANCDQNIANAIHRAVRLELDVRSNGRLLAEWWEQVELLPEMLRDLVLCCAAKWHPEVNKCIMSPALKGAKK